ncbi:MAG: hypothetical protein V3V14_11510 [Saprospiraceae bacterium]
MNILELNRKMNVSSILLLQLFGDVCEGILTDKKYNCPSAKIKNNRIKIPIQLLSHMYGLKNTYLHGKYLILVFDEKKSSIDHKISTSQYSTFIDLLRDSVYFSKEKIVKSEKNLRIVSLEIPSLYIDNGDIDKITNGQYSKVSENFKSLMKIDLTTYKELRIFSEFENNVFFYTIQTALPLNIVNRGDKLRKRLVDGLGINVDQLDGIEYYNIWNPEKEEWKYAKEYKCLYLSLSTTKQRELVLPSKLKKCS